VGTRRQSHGCQDETDHQGGRKPLHDHLAWREMGPAASVCARRAVFEFRCNLSANPVYLMVYRPAHRFCPAVPGFVPDGSRWTDPMFEGIQRSLTDALRRLRGRGRLTAANIHDGLQEVRKALLDADVNFTVANDFIERVEKKAVGQEVLRTLD